MSDTAIRPASELRVKEVAFLLGVSPKTVYDWCYSSSIKFSRVGGSIRISVSAALLKRQEPTEQR